MTVKALLIGSLGVLVDLTDMDCVALAQALAESGLDIDVTPRLVGEVVGHPEGARRLEDHAAGRGATIDARRVLDRQRSLLLDRLEAGPLGLRREIGELIGAARSAGIRVGLVTTSPRAHVGAVLKGLGTALPAEAFDLIVSREDVAEEKPSPGCYAIALQRLGLDQSEAVAIEDSPTNARAARKALLTTLAVPPRAHANRDFPARVLVTDRPAAAILSLTRAA